MKPKKPVLQLALDFVDLERAIHIAEEAVAGGVDWIEAGTPLIKSEGLNAVRALRRHFPNHVIVADMKTMDAGRAEVEVAAKAGATYVSPFIGRLDDISHFGMELIRDMREIFDNYDFRTKILVASIRHPVHVVEAALAGADVATIPFEVIEKLLNHPLTDRGQEKFLEDWEKVRENSRDQGSGIRKE